jgi:NUBPL iron-transfer P-loop NTPase
MSRVISLYAFCSIKGGVGKSTLAVATAKLLAGTGRVPVLIDADLTGTSLADGLRLRAPVLALRPDGTLDLDAEPTGAYYEIDETLRLRNARKASAWTDRAPPPAYLNDALTYVGGEGGPDCRIDGMLWRHEREDSVRYLPSSPLPRDVSIGLGWIYNEEPFRWMRRFTWVLDALLQRDRDVTDIVIDLPPGVWGFAHETLVLVSALSSGALLPDGYPSWGSDLEWRAYPFLVTTPDLNDVLPALEYVAAQSARIPSLVPILNRSTESLPDVQRGIRERLGPSLGALGIEEKLKPIESMPQTLGRIFREQNLVLNDEIKRALSNILLKEHV